MLLYTDPGSGAMIWQLLLAFIFGATFYFSRFKEWISARMNKGKETSPVDAGQDSYTAKTAPIASTEE